MIELLILASITLALMSLYTIALCAIGLKRAVATYLTRGLSETVKYAPGGTFALIRHAVTLHVVLIREHPMEGVVYVPFTCVTHPQYMIAVFEEAMTLMIKSGDVRLDVEEAG